MENCGSCKHYVYNPVQGPSCPRTGKAVSYLMQKDCFEPITEQTPDVVTKVCNRCHRMLPITAFNRKSNTKDGYQFQCKECQAEMARQLYQKRKEEQAKAVSVPETKTCRQCGRELPVSMFGNAPKNQHGLKSYCRDCENENCRKYRAKRKAARQKEKSEHLADQIQDAPVRNNLAEMAIPVEELTFAKALRQLIAYGSLTITINLSTPDK